MAIHDKVEGIYHICYFYNTLHLVEWFAPPPQAWKMFLLYLSFVAFFSVQLKAY